jgi:hypothetical protein
MTKIHPLASVFEDAARREWLKTWLIENIWHFSKAKRRKAAIRAWVIENYPEMWVIHLRWEFPCRFWIWRFMEAGGSSEEGMKE